ncbi:BON domain-containing protein [Corticibacter populi]|uniref:BON domain-containing protein n=1 Tax=Corticibacter populi TaxID=1550736 RepID=A0A3M6QYL9_9BURK|nr:BON domain-containing protein [Corticibacter populi]RMX08114.1 BON domain-containing protein [Corticibacter populi]RZS35364.1 BON domain-containing protein [Corticibacter populi]
MTTTRFTQALALAAALGIAAVTATGCAVARDQQTVGSYIDDAAITTAVKAKLAEDPTTSAIAISVETLKGEVQLSGFAKSQAEKDRAAAVARSASQHVRSVKNNIVVRP